MEKHNIPEILSIPVYRNFSLNNCRKDSKNYTSSLLVLGVDSNNEIQKAIDARFYETRTRVYCCVWIMTPDWHICGGNYASGYGVHLYSVALSEALKSCGIEHTKLSGYGDDAMEAVLLTLANMVNDKFGLGLKNFKCITTHA